MNNVLHGPFKSGKNRLTAVQAAEFLATKLEDNPDDFEHLRELMASDLGIDVDDDQLPANATDIPTLPCLKSLPSFVTGLSQI